MSEHESGAEAARLEAFRENIKRIVDKLGGRESNAMRIVDFGQLNSEHQLLWDTYGKLLGTALQERPDYVVIEGSARGIAQRANELAQGYRRSGEQTALAFCTFLSNRLTLIISNIPLLVRPQYRDEILAEWKQEFDFHFGS